MSLLKYLTILRAWRFTILGILFFCVGIAVAASMLLPKTYTATTSVLVDVKMNEPTGGAALGTALLPETLQAYIATQAEVMSSEPSTLKVIEALGLAKDAQLRAAWEALQGNKLPFDDWLVDRLRRKLQVRPSRDRNVIELTFSDGNATRAADVANAYARAYLDTTLDLRVDPARSSAAFFSEQTAAARTKLAQAQTRLSDFQRTRGIIVNDERLDAETARLAELSRELAMVQGSVGEAEAKRRQAGDVSDVQLNPLVQGLRTEVAKAESKLRDVASQYGRNHPLYQRAEAELATLRESLATETSRATNTVGATANVARDRESRIRAAYDAQRGQVAAMKLARDQAFLLVRDVENATKEYEAVLARFGQTRLESQVRQTNVTILNRAVAPIYPSSPKLFVNVALAVFVGTLAGVLVALGLEARDRPIRNSGDLFDTLGVPVLAELVPEPFPRGRGGSGGLPRLPAPGR
jgi:chain length determinant protein EpsF